jgi:hypothetical protein
VEVTPQRSAGHEKKRLADSMQEPRSGSKLKPKNATDPPASSHKYDETLGSEQQLAISSAGPALKHTGKHKVTRSRADVDSGAKIHVDLI